MAWCLPPWGYLYQACWVGLSLNFHLLFSWSLGPLQSAAIDCSHLPISLPSPQAGHWAGGGWHDHLQQQSTVAARLQLCLCTSGLSKNLIWCGWMRLKKKKTPSSSPPSLCLALHCWSKKLPLSFILLINHCSKKAVLLFSLLFW